MFRRLLRRATRNGVAAPPAKALSFAASTTRAPTTELSAAHREQTLAVLASLGRHQILFDDEYELDDVLEYVSLNGPDDPDDPIEFAEVVGSVAHGLDPLTNLVFIPAWNELAAPDIEEFTEAICWLAQVNTHAIATIDPVDPSRITVDFELEPGEPTSLDLGFVPKGIPEGLIEGLAAVLSPRLGPRSIVASFESGDCVLSALDPGTMLAVNVETSAGYSPV